jgi:hypothetical protein
MRGSFVGLSLDSSLNDLALKFNVTLEVRVSCLSIPSALTPRACTVDRPLLFKLVTYLMR